MLAPTVGIAAACHVLDVPRAFYYSQHPLLGPAPQMVHYGRLRRFAICASRCSTTLISPTLNASSIAPPKPSNCQLKSGSTNRQDRTKILAKLT